MKIYHVAALSENHVIGRGSKIPWHHREDLRRFKEITLGHPVIMGRKTFESLLPYAPLKGRLNIILSSKDTLYYDGRPVLTRGDNPGVTTPNTDGGDALGTKMALVPDIGSALALCKGKHEVYIIGGGQLYADTMDVVDELRLTIVHKHVEGGDAFYPEIDPGIWQASYTQPGPEYSFVDYVRRAQ